MSALSSFMAYLEREAARRAKGTPAGVVKLRDEEIAALIRLIRRELATEARP